MKRNPPIKCLQNSRVLLRANPVVRHRVVNVSHSFTKLHLHRLWILLHACHIAARTRTLSCIAATYAPVPPAGTGGLRRAGDERSRSRNERYRRLVGDGTSSASHLRATPILSFSQLGKAERLAVDIEQALFAGFVKRADLLASGSSESLLEVCL